MASSDSIDHLATCPLCEATCGLRIRTIGDRIESITGDQDDPFSAGYLCPKARALGDLHDDPDRLRRPLRRTGGDWVEIGWEEALTAAAGGLAAIQRRHGNNAVASYFGNPVIHNLGALLYAGPLWQALDSANRYTASSVDTHAHIAANIHCFGSGFLVPVPDLDHTELLVIIGADPLVSNGSFMTAPGIGRRLARLRARGGRIVVVDPRRSRTAERADVHLSIRPGTDPFLLVALLQRLLDDRRPTPLDNLVRNEWRLRELLDTIDPDICATATGIGHDQIDQLADALSKTPTAAVYGRYGLSTQRFGTLSVFLIHVLNLVTGNLDRQGGVMFPTPAVDLRSPPRGSGLETGSYNTERSRVRGLPAMNGEFPVATLADEILTPGPGQVRGLLTWAGNPALSAPDGPRLEAALPELEFMVSIDHYLNETTRHADVILPPVSSLQRSHYDAFLYHFAVRNVARFAPPVLPTGADERQDWEILAELACRLTKAKGRTLTLPGVTARLTRKLGPERILDVLLKTGPHGWRRGGRRLSLNTLRRRPHGIDLGPLVPGLPALLPRHHRYIDLAPAPIVKDLQRLRAEPPPRPGLLLVGRRQLRNSNSWIHNVDRLMTGPDRCTLLIHPADAEDLDLTEGAMVVVESTTGSVDVPAELTDTVARGTVSLPHGFGHHRPGTRLRVASQRPGVSMNDLTDANVVDTNSGSAVLNAIPVTVRRHQL